LSVAHLAANLKVSAKTITALEDNNMAALPDLAFSRALASSICRTLKISSGPILAMMPSLPQAHVVTNQEVGLNLPMASPFKFNVSLAWFKTSAFAIFAVLALATLAVANWPTVLTWVDEVQKMSAASTAGMDSDRPTLAQVSSGDVTSPPSSVKIPVNPDIDTSTPSVAVPSAVASSAAPAVPSLGAVSSAAAAVPSIAPAALAATGSLAFKATGSSWIEVTDLAGKPVWKKLLAANEEAQVPVGLPVRVVIGNAAGTSLAVNGASFNFTPFLVNNVARFEVK
jgi:cytoskeleton protein RodZ